MIATTAGSGLPSDATMAASRYAAAIALMAALTLAGAWFFQLVLGLQPCPLCLEQRYAYYLAVPLAIVVAVAAARDAPRSLIYAGLVALFNVALAGGLYALTRRA